MVTGLARHWFTGQRGNQGDQADLEAIEDTKVYRPFIESGQQHIHTVVVGGTIRGVEDGIDRRSATEEIVPEDRLVELCYIEIGLTQHPLLAVCSAWASLFRYQ